jgi:hypothetical protein
MVIYGGGRLNKAIATMKLPIRIERKNKAKIRFLFFLFIWLHLFQ